ncbi:MAG: uroporphyrinogen decarboxylase [Elusimicrobia bacterium]|nr:uroporphyrinogen decarboxylase [Elusimicrobiota bacterium]
MPEKGFRGLRVAAFESRLARETADLIERNGGEPLVAPALQEIPVSENPEAFAFAEKLFSGQVDMLVLMTGVGLRALMEVLETKHGKADILKALAKVLLVARGPKPVSVLAEMNLKPQVVAPEPNTWRDVLQAVGETVRGKCVAVQEYGTPPLEFLKTLEERGAKVVRVPVYRWSLPKDTKPLERAIREITEGRVRAAIFTTAMQVNNLFQVAQEMGLSELLHAALRRLVVASVGPTCSERLAQYAVPVDFEPSHPKLGVLILEMARRIDELMAQKSLFMRACRREPTERAPIWLMRQAGRYMKSYRELRAKVSMLELCKSPDLVAEVTVDAVRQLDVDAAILFSDLLLPVEPLGFELEYSKGDGPLIRPSIRSAEDVQRLKAVDVKSSLGFVADAVRKTRAALPPHIPLLGFAGAPFTLASYLIEGGSSRNFVQTKTFMYKEPVAWDQLLRAVSVCLTDLLNMQIEAGAQAVQLFDSWVGCLSPQDYERYVLPYSRQVLSGVMKGTPVIHFGTQNGALLELMKKAGGTVIGLDWRVSVAEAWKRLGDDVAVMGNLDPAVLFSTTEEMESQVRRILKEAAGRPGYIFNLGHGILPDTPYENVLALVKMVKELSATS